MLRGIFVTTLLAAALATAPEASGARAAGAQGGQISLKEMLETGLMARRPEEFQFIAKVVSKVNEGKVPRSLVEGTFFWARNKRPYPYPYFERGLKERAKKLNVSI